MSRRVLTPVTVLALGLRAAACGAAVTASVRYADGGSRPLDLARYVGEPSRADATVVERCTGATLDIGCGPGRFTAAVAARGVPALGTDLCPEAVRQCRARGAAALLGDVFAAVPGEGRWHHLLLTDGNIGIGADPARLLRRAAELMRPGGELVCEADSPDVPLTSARIRLELQDGPVSEWFDWARIGVAELADLAARCALRITDTWTETGRWFVACSPN